VAGLCTRAWQQHLLLPAALVRLLPAVLLLLLPLLLRQLSCQVAAYAVLLLCQWHLQSLHPGAWAQHHCLLRRLKVLSPWQLSCWSQ
jgi:hypothetical protein